MNNYLFIARFDAPVPTEWVQGFSSELIQDIFEGDVKEDWNMWGTALLSGHKPNRNYIGGTNARVQ